MARNNALAISPQSATRKSKRAESFQSNYLDEVVFVESQQLETAASGVTDVPTIVHPQQASASATTDNLMLEALLGSTAPNAAGETQPARNESLSSRRTDEDEKRRRKEAERKLREQARKEFEMNASMYERDGDIYFVDESEALPSNARKTANELSSPKSSVGSHGSHETADDDAMLAAILEHGNGGGANSNMEEQKKKLDKEKQQQQEQQEEERRQRKEVRRRKKEAQRRAQEEFAQAASNYGGGEAQTTGYLATDEEAEAAPQQAKWNEYFLEEQKPFAGPEDEPKLPAARKELVSDEVEDEQLLNTILKSSGQDHEPAKTVSHDAGQAEVSQVEAKQHSEASAAQKREGKEQRAKMEELVRLEEAVAEARFLPRPCSPADLFVGLTSLFVSFGQPAGKKTALCCPIASCQRTTSSCCLATSIDPSWKYGARLLFRKLRIL